MFGLIPRREREMVGHPLPRLRDEFKTLFDRVFDGWPLLYEPLAEREPFWGLEMKETDREVAVRAEIPGFELADLDVELRKGRLIIKAEKKFEVEKKEEKEYAERRYERFVDLPVEVDPEKIEATYRAGVLEVHLPKKEEVKGRHITVK